MIAKERYTPTYSSLWERTKSCLGALGVSEWVLGREWSDPANYGETITFTASRWLVGPRDEPIADSRIAKFTGAADGLILLIGPIRAGRLPYFAAELLAVDGRPEFACLDLHAPGMAAELLDEIVAQTIALSIRHTLFLPRDEAVPRWAVEESPGGFLYTGVNSPAVIPRLEQAFEDYLNIWLDFAHAGPAIAAADAIEAVESFRLMRRCRPSILERFVGRERTGRLMAEFCR